MSRLAFGSPNDGAAPLNQSGLARAFSSRRIGPYTLQAAIAAVHTEAVTAAATDWTEIVGLYDVLVRVNPSPVVQLNRAAAIAMRGQRGMRRHS